MTRTPLAFLLLCSSLFGCVAQVDAPADEEIFSVSEELRDGRLLERVVLGRMYQKGRWMIPEADIDRGAGGTRADRRIAYVCQALAVLQPTYVSGLIRLSYDTEITDEMIEIFQGVKDCVAFTVAHPVRFDVVLNAEHFTMPRGVIRRENREERARARAEGREPKLITWTGVTSDRDGRERVLSRLRSANRAFHPDIWFFDFYTNPFNQHAHRWYTRPMRDAMRWIHQHDQLVGGNAWGQSVPRGTDFAAIPLEDDLNDESERIAAIQEQVPTLVHIRNDPHIPGSAGRRWFQWEPEERASWIRRRASKQSEFGVGLMYNLFFPLTPPGPDQQSYDAVADGLVDRMADIMDENPYRPR